MADSSDAEPLTREKMMTLNSVPNPTLDPGQLGLVKNCFGVSGDKLALSLFHTLSKTPRYVSLRSHPGNRGKVLP